MTDPHDLALGMESGVWTAKDIAREAVANIGASVHLRAITFEPPTDDVDAEAAAADRRRASGTPRSEFDGIPYLAKDLFDLAGWPTSRGLPAVFRDVAARDSWLDGRLRGSGFTPVGKTNLDELGLGVIGANPSFGQVVNPRWPSTLTGGSSAGSAAAVAAGIVPVATATDTAGSLSIPAAWCGVTGLKMGRAPVRTTGVAPVAASLDQVGLLCSTARACRTVAEAIGLTDHPERDGSSGLTIGLVLPSHVDSEVATQVGEAALHLRSRKVRLVELHLATLEDAHRAAGKLLLTEAATEYGWLLRADVALSGLTRRQLEIGLTRPFGPRDEEVVRSWASELDAVFARLDAVWLPVTATPAPSAGVRISVADVTKFTLPWNLGGTPTLSIPVGVLRSGHPVSALIAVPAGCESRLLEIGDRVEETVRGVWVD